MSKEVRILLKSVSDLTGLTRLARAVRDHVPGVKALETAYKGVSAALTGMARVGGAALRTLRTGALALTGAIAGSVREFATFNVGMARAWTMMGGGIKQFREMRSAIVDMSAELGVAKDQLSSGLYQALSAGVPEDNVLNFLRTAAKVAVADGSTIETAVDGITTVLNAWGLSADQTEAVTDKLFKTVANGKTTFSQLAASISQAAPVAASMGVDVDQLLAAVATLTKQGTPTATAMVQIRNALTRVNDEMGDGWSKTMSFQEALESVAKQAGYSQQALTKIFGREGVAAISAMTGANFGAAVSDLDSMQSSAGSLAGAFGKVEQELQHWPRLWQTIRAYITNIGESIETRIRPAVRAVTEQLNAFRQTDAFKNFADSFGETVQNFVDNLLAGIITAGQALKRVWSEGAGAVAATLKTLLVEGFTLAGTALIEFLRANLEIFLTIGRLIGQTIVGEFLKSDLPGAKTAARNAAAKTLTENSGADLTGAGLSLGPYTANEGRSTRPVHERTAQNMVRNMSREELAALATFSRGNNLEDAITRSQGNLAGSASRMSAAVNRSFGNVSDTFQNGMGMDLSGTFQANRDLIRSYTRPGESGAHADSPAEAPADRREFLRGILRERQGMLQQDAVNHDRMGVSQGGNMRKRNTEDMAAVVAALTALEEDRMDDINRLLAAYDSLAKRYEDQRRIVRNLPL